MYRIPLYTEISSFRNVLIDQRESSCCTLSDGKLLMIIIIDSGSAVCRGERQHESRGAAAAVYVYINVYASLWGSV